MATINNQDNNNRQINNVASSKQPLQSAKSIDTQSVLKRLQAELMSLMMGGDPGIYAFPEEDNIFCWKGTITESKDTMFEGTEYKLSLSFPTDYPFKPPKTFFRINKPSWRTKHEFPFEHLGSSTVGKSRRIQEDGGEIVQAFSLASNFFTFGQRERGG
ncbi:hypothetical protein ACET3Z_029079 [Daucus carota]